MDTISRDSNSPSYAPIAAVIIGLLALVLSIVGLVKVNSLSKDVTPLKGISDRVDSIQNDARTAASSADAAKSNISNLASQTQRAFDSVTAELGNLRTEMSKLSAPAPKVSSSSSSGASSTAGTAKAEPGTYIVASGDTGVKIAKANGVSLTDLMGANPDVDWRRLKVGQKLKIPGGH